MQPQPSQPKGPRTLLERVLELEAKAENLENSVGALQQALSNDACRVSAIEHQLGMDGPVCASEVVGGTQRF